ncbi:MAG: hypothetical protein ACP5TY_08965 [Thermodesulforhabdaceae bacterium]
MMRFILFLLLVYCVYLIWRYVKRNILTPDQTHNRDVKREPTRIAELVQDPECGVYVVKDKALVARIDGKDVHFCSERCRDKYIERRREERKS